LGVFILSGVICIVVVRDKKKITMQFLTEDNQADLLVNEVEGYADERGCTRQEKVFISKLVPMNVYETVGLIPDMSRYRPTIRDVCQRLVNFKLNYNQFKDTLGWEDEYMMFCLNSFVCSGSIYDSDTEHALDLSILEEIYADPDMNLWVRRTQCMYCRASKPCMSLDKSKCSTRSNRMRCDALSCIHLCNAHGLKSGVSFDREPFEDLPLDDGRVLKTTFHIARKKKACPYGLKGKRTTTDKK